MTLRDQIETRDTAPPSGDSEFVQFWNEVLAPKFTRFRHVLVGGLTYHSEAVFPKLPVKAGDRVLDVGCGWGEQPARIRGRGAREDGAILARHGRPRRSAQYARLHGRDERPDEPDRPDGALPPPL